jgi:hypothetical protein
VRLALLIAVKFHPALHVWMGLCIQIIILTYHIVFNHALIVLNFINLHKLVACSVIKRLKLEEYLIHQNVFHATHLAMSVMDHLKLNVSAARKGTTFSYLIFLFLMVHANKWYQMLQRILNFMLLQKGLSVAIQLKIQQEMLILLSKTFKML